MEHTKLATLHATFPLAPGINALYKVGRRGQHCQMYSSPEYEAWKVQADLAADIRSWPTFAKGVYTLEVDIRLYCTMQHDIDGPIKATLDLIERTLGINDRSVGKLTVERQKTARAFEQQQVTVHIYRKVPRVLKSAAARKAETAPT